MLTEQKKLFVNEYMKLRCKNATKAAIAAGYSEKTASSQASMLLKNIEVAEYLRECKETMEKEIREEFIFDALEAQKVLYEVLTDENADDRDRIAAAKDFLDRAGFKAENNVRVTGSGVVQIIDDIPADDSHD